MPVILTLLLLLLLLLFNCNWVDTRWQSYSTHLHTNSTHNTENRTYITIKRKGRTYGKCGPCPAFASYTLAFTLQLRKKHGKTSVRVVEKCPDIPVAVVQYTFVNHTL
jgi:predicted secreted Zn-dependent protease